MQKITYLNASEIDLQKWDDCINKASNKLVYACSFYLNHMAGKWDALVLNDYEAVMPLPWRKKAGIYYLYQPFLTAQLGLFGNDLSADLLGSFLQAVPAKFKFWELSFNHKNLFALSQFNLTERKNYVLDLNHSYDALQQQYRENTKRNIKKSVSYGCYPETDIDIKNIIELANATAPLPEKDVRNFIALYEFLKTKGSAKTYGICAANGQLLASCVFIFFQDRAYYILVGNHPNGRTLGASHALIDEFIRNHAGQKLLLDFEGSDISSLAFFYSSFGAREENYAAIKLNRLPWWGRWK